MLIFMVILLNTTLSLSASDVVVSYGSVQTKTIYNFENSEKISINLSIISNNINAIPTLRKMYGVTKIPKIY